MSNENFSTFTRREAAAGFASMALMLAAGRPARASWPDRTITIIVHFAPGGSNDLLARLIAQELAPALGQSIVVENRPGAAGNVGVSAAARSEPNGYTLLVASGSALANPAMGKVPYDFAKDFSPIAYLGASPNVFVTGPRSGVVNAQELLMQAKARPGAITYASPGTGSVGHLAVELLKLRAGIDLTHVPFTGLAPAVTATIGGTTDLAIVTTAGVMGQIESGELRAILQTGSRRWPELPDVPTVGEVGIPDAASEVLQVFVAPSATPADVVDRLEHETLQAMRKPEVRQRMLKLGFLVDPQDGAFARVKIESDLERWRDVAEKAGLHRN